MINIPGQEYALCLPVDCGQRLGLWAHWPLVGKEGWLGFCLGGPEASFSPVWAREGWGLLPGAGLQRGQNQLETSGARREGGFVSSKDTSKAKNYIPGRLSMLV